jgi:hypothetical protein
MAIELEHRYERISSKAYEHPADRAATSALHSVPLLDKVIKRLTDLGHERRLRQIVMGNAVRIGSEQMPDLWADYVRAATILDLPSVPDLYVTNDPVVNAMTVGAKTPSSSSGRPWWARTKTTRHRRCSPMSWAMSCPSTITTRPP